MEISGISVPQIAMVCHEANRAYCLSIGDGSQPMWEYAPAWQLKSAMDGVVFHLEVLQAGGRPRPDQSHESWLAAKAADGWKYGPVKDPEKKEHPCFVPYNELPLQQRLKDFIFCSIVEAFWNGRPQTR